MLGTVSFQCHTLYEKYEEVLENFWFKHYAQKKKTDLREYLCINRVRGTSLSLVQKKNHFLSARHEQCERAQCNHHCISRCLYVCVNSDSKGGGVFESNIFLDSGDATQFDSDFFPLGRVPIQKEGRVFESSLRRNCPLLPRSFEDPGLLFLGGASFCAAGKFSGGASGMADLQES